jgi:hypothetical protein
MSHRGAVIRWSGRFAPEFAQRSHRVAFRAIGKPFPTRANRSIALSHVAVESDGSLPLDSMVNPVQRDRFVRFPRCSRYYSQGLKKTVNPWGLTRHTRCSCNFARMAALHCGDHTIGGRVNPPLISENAAPMGVATRAPTALHLTSRRRLRISRPLRRPAILLRFGVLVKAPSGRFETRHRAIHRA